MRVQEKIIWFGSLSHLVIVFISVLLGKAASISFLQSNLDIFIALFPFVLVLLHSFSTQGVKRGSFLIAIAFLTGLIFEFVGLNNNWLFGGEYFYKSTSLMIFNLPLIVPLYWALFIYTGYSLTNSFLSEKRRIKRSFFLILLLLILDGFFVTAIDLFMDPLQVKVGVWTWVEGGPYFGVPIGNFVGWFIVTITATSIFRVYEYFFPKRKTETNKSLVLIPILGYGGMALALLIFALQSNLPSLAIIGSLLMFPSFFLALFFFLKPKTLTSHFILNN